MGVSLIFLVRAMQPWGHLVIYIVVLNNYRVAEIVEWYVLSMGIKKEIQMLSTAKLFTTGRGQAVQLPMEFRFQGTEVFIRRNPATGEVVLSPKPTSWQEFFELADRTDIPADFMTDREDLPAEERKLF